MSVAGHSSTMDREGPQAIMVSFTLSALFCAAVLSSIALGTDAEVCQCMCPGGWTHFGGRCFKYVDAKKDWASAEVHCVNEGGNLASVHSEEEYNFIRQLVNTHAGQKVRFWMGLTDSQKEGTWLWSDGSKVDYTKWNPGEPNNSNGEDCGEGNFSNSEGWNDVACKNTFASVCVKTM
ncbi:hypothetical protein JZ751_000936 [Albula glossodonta]|uniref:C-type lectin domain-containing protein n=1 Tax=Albula glossodonta TaxID=121402 RepID=A0A8T2PX40_9TELE|nr:hypothetical protein JZ751_000936 [Albula glossodonta]